MRISRKALATAALTATGVYLYTAARNRPPTPEPEDAPPAALLPMGRYAMQVWEEKDDPAFEGQLAWGAYCADCEADAWRTGTPDRDAHYDNWLATGHVSTKYGIDPVEIYRTDLLPHEKAHHTHA